MIKDYLLKKKKEIKFNPGSMSLKKERERIKQLRIKFRFVKKVPNIKVFNENIKCLTSYYFPDVTSDYPDVKRDNMKVKMTKQQNLEYKKALNLLSSEEKKSIENGGQFTGKMGTLNAFLNLTRRISNISSTEKTSPKLDKILNMCKNGDILFVTKETKIKGKSLTKKNEPFIRKYKYNKNNIKLENNDNKFLVYILSNYEVQTIIGLLVMMCTTENKRIRQCILQTYDAFICKKRGFNLLEVATSKTLYDFFKTNEEKLTLDDIKKIFLQLFKTLIYLQDKIDFVHGDIKLANIFCSGKIEDNTFRIKIADLDIGSATYKKDNKTIRILSRKDSCFMFKKSKFKKYEYNGKYYFKTGINKLKTRCLVSYTINNIDISKILDLLVCLINIMFLKKFRIYIYTYHINTLLKILKEKNIFSKINDYTEKQIKSKIKIILKILKKFKFKMAIYYILLGIFTIPLDMVSIIKNDLINKFENEENLDMFRFRN